MTQAFADCVGFECPTCHAAKGDLCTFTVNGHVFRRHSPCTARHLLADKAASS